MADIIIPFVPTSSGGGGGGNVVVTNTPLPVVVTSASSAIRSRATVAALTFGITADLDSAPIVSLATLTGLYISGTGPFKADLRVNAGLPMHTETSWDGATARFEPPVGAYFTAGAGDVWRVSLTNCDTSGTNDYYVTFLYSE